MNNPQKPSEQINLKKENNVSELASDQKFCQKEKAGSRNKVAKLLQLLLYLFVGGIAFAIETREVTTNNSEHISVREQVDCTKDINSIKANDSVRDLFDNRCGYIIGNLKIEGLEILEEHFEITEIKNGDDLIISNSSGAEHTANSIKLQLKANQQFHKYNMFSYMGINSELELHYLDREGNLIEPSFLANYIMFSSLPNSRDSFNSLDISTTKREMQATLFIPQNTEIKIIRVVKK